MIQYAYWLRSFDCDAIRTSKNNRKTNNDHAHTEESGVEMREIRQRRFSSIFIYGHSKRNRKNSHGSSHTHTHKLSIYAFALVEFGRSIDEDEEKILILFFGRFVFELFSPFVLSQASVTKKRWRRNTMKRYGMGICVHRISIKLTQWRRIYI